MNQLQALYRLQQLESSIDAAKKRTDDITLALENDETVKRCKAEFAMSEAELHQTQAHVKDLELDISGLTNKAYESESLLYSGKITNPKELQEKQEEIASLTRRKASREAELVEAQHALKAAERLHTQNTATLHEAEQERDANSQELLKEQQKLRKDMGNWLQDRKTTLKSVDESHHKIYKKIKAAKNGVAVARLNEESCEICRVEQYQNIIYQVRQHTQIVYCHHCGRILVEF